MRMNKTDKKYVQELDKLQEVEVKDTRENFPSKRLKVLKLSTSLAKYGALKTKRERVIVLLVQLCLAISFQEKHRKAQGIEDD